MDTTENKIVKKKYKVTGMSCAACSAHVEKSVSKLPGMIKVNVNLLNGTMDAEYYEDQTSSEEIIKAVEKGGYGASARFCAGGGETRDQDLPQHRRGRALRRLRR